MSRVLQVISLVLIVGISVLAYFLTSDSSQDDPCLAPQNDISAAILGEDEDQDALANRAMLQRKLCEQRREEQTRQ